MIDARASGFRRTDGDDWSRVGMTPEMVHRYKTAFLAARAPSPWKEVAADYRAILERLYDLGDGVLAHEMAVRFGHTDFATMLDSIELVHTAVHD